MKSDSFHPDSSLAGERPIMDLTFAVPMIIYIGTIIYIVSLLQRIAKAVERVAANTERTPSS